MRRNNDGWWKAFGVLGVMIGIGMTMVSFLLYQKNRKYRDALILASEHIPDDSREARRAEWQSHYAPVNQRTTEEKLDDRRMVEE